MLDPSCMMLWSGPRPSTKCKGFPCSLRSTLLAYLQLPGAHLTFSVDPTASCAKEVLLSIGASSMSGMLPAWFPWLNMSTIGTSMGTTTPSGPGTARALECTT